jgi:hypothetical protein
MANDPTPESIDIGPAWVDLYAASGLEVGLQVLVNCRGQQSVYLAESVAAPADDLDGVECYPTRQLIVDEGSIGLWCRTAKATVAGRVVVQRDSDSAP